MLRIYIADDFMGSGIKISIVREHTDHSQLAGPRCERTILRISDDPSGRHAHRWEEVSNDGRVVEPTLRLDEETARTLLDVLTRHYQGAEDTRALRRDYDHERKRVDQLVGSLTAIAGTLASP